MGKNFVYTTSAYDEDAKRYNCKGVVDSLKKSLEKRSEDWRNRSRDILPGIPYLRKLHGKKVTVLYYEERKINGEDVCCYIAVRVFNHDTEWLRFADNKTGESERLRIIDHKKFVETELSEFWADVEKRMNPDLEEVLKPLSEGENYFLHRDTSVVKPMFEHLIYETNEWVDVVAKQEGHEGYPHIVELGNKIVNNKGEGLYPDWATDPSVTADCSFKLIRETLHTGANGDVHCVACCGIVKKDENQKDIYHWFNLGVGTQSFVDKTVKKYQDYIDRNDFEGLARHCRRGYPYSILERDKDAWQKMEEDRDSSLILSNEELGVLSEELKFPLFLTGRAGSGKSTMLQYLFSEYLLRYAAYGVLRNKSTGIVEVPIYLSWSRALADKARKVAETLLKKNPAYTNALAVYGLTYDKDIEPILAKSFKSFEELVRGCVEEYYPRELKQRFARGKYIWLFVHDCGYSFAA